MNVNGIAILFYANQIFLILENLILILTQKKLAILLLEIKGLVNIQRVLKVHVIEVKKINDGLYEVLITHDGTTSHLITLNQNDYEKYSHNQCTPEELINASFQFLLDRESNQSILKKFALSVIENYFPEYPDELSKYLN